MTPGGRVVCLGDVMVDVVALLSGELAPGSDSPASIRLSGGGSAANTACWLVRLGTDVSLVARVGDDEFGRSTLRELRAFGVRIETAVDPTEPTGICIVLVGSQGQRSMIPSAGANAALSSVDVDSVDLAASDHLHVSAYSLLRPQTRAAARQALNRAQSVGAGLSVDVASAVPLAQVGGSQFLSWLPRECLLLLNADEARVLVDGVDLPTAALTLAGPGRRVVIKDGPRGAIWAQDGVAGQVVTTPVESVDTTGAGDAFAAGLIDALRKGATLTQAVVAGNSVGALAVGQPGGRPPPPRPAEEGPTAASL
ncbi:MAG: ribokinase [Frankiales bacterium]|nr:ribokinase [Frankiales bacterium]